VLVEWVLVDLYPFLDERGLSAPRFLPCLGMYIMIRLIKI
jgi:hypothetical protein